jgi:hypothetical protein
VPLSYQDRSSIRSIALQIVQKFIDRHHRFTRWGTAPNRDRRRHPSLPEGVQQKRVRQHRAPGGARRAYFRNNSITIGDQNGLAAGGNANVLTQFVLKDFDANGPHSRNVATESYFVKTPRWSTEIAKVRPRRSQSAFFRPFELLHWQALRIPMPRGDVPAV